MAAPTISELTHAAANASEPFFVPDVEYRFGGVDPLGLRQLNFDMMDEVLPGINNVARHIRPFTLVAWAWHRAIFIAKEQEFDAISVGKMLDFVDRIDVIYVWSQFLRKPDSDLPGRTVLDPLIKSPSWVFDGADWRARREARRLSTALMAPINYGPALKSMGWIQAHQRHPSIFMPGPAAAPAITAFEEQISSFLAAPAFSQFGPVEVSASDVLSWADAWALDNPTDAERQVMSEMLLGDKSPAARQRGCALMLAAAGTVSAPTVENVRSAMAGAPANFVPPGSLEQTQVAWRCLQVRQLFRLALEALFFWVSSQLAEGVAMPTTALVSRFLEEYSENGLRSQLIDWFGASVSTDGPVELQAMIVSALDNSDGSNLPLAIVDGLRLCLTEPTSNGSCNPLGRPDRTNRLPLHKAKQDAETWARSSTNDFLRNVLEHWIFAQHVFWAVGRGFADARVRGKTILRLKIVLEENGWASANGVAQASKPSPTADRLETALMLAKECRLGT